ncbi:hypothetical protein LJ207_02380 [Halanaerobium sp. Z-7514]|uniref:Uncharacterized protein n=1 Tax=Halanaerobium polyolivorans TaxID=2886943 RepID=A0AAW4WXM6_9FIRM|nr:hypothetical protein [Halanaerobium polyolivorans]MCC3144164.1 hypothetical protein [Halanaerobium polyolivorans]RQD73207.1 MAG: hypothetical protein D5S01_08240 [Halanaerobium sp. MSAO_Bac5]
MEDIYKYNNYKFLEKIYTPIGVVMAGILLQFFYPVSGFYQRILIYLIYLSAVLLFVFDAVPIIISTYKAWNKEVVLTNRTVIVKGDNHMETKIVNRSDINKIVFRTLRGEDVEIPHYRKLEDIDEDIYEMPGRKFVIDYDSDTADDNLVIYLELLPEEFIEEFIKWYQADVALK